MEDSEILDMAKQLKNQSFFKRIVVVRQLFVET